jgi:hypothetical protein
MEEESSIRGEQRRPCSPCAHTSRSQKQSSAARIKLRRVSMLRVLARTKDPCLRGNPLQRVAQRHCTGYVISVRIPGMHQQGFSQWLIYPPACASKPLTGKTGLLARHQFTAARICAAWRVHSWSRVSPSNGSKAGLLPPSVFFEANVALGTSDEMIYQFNVQDATYLHQLPDRLDVHLRRRQVTTGDGCGRGSVPDRCA